MTIDEAIENYNELIHKRREFTPYEENLFIDSLKFLIEIKGDSFFMMALGGYYYGKKKFDLSKKYYEMAEEAGDVDAYNCLGYIYYYGRCGAPDYKKAFEYYSLAMKYGNIEAAYKVSDFYRNGKLGFQDLDKAKSILLDIVSSNDSEVEYYIPEIYSRLGSLEADEEKAYNYLFVARERIIKRLKNNRFFGNYTICSIITNEIHDRFNKKCQNIDFFDLYYYLSYPNVISLKIGDKKLMVKSFYENNMLCVCFNDEYYKSINDFFIKAEIDGINILDYFYNDKIEVMINE